MILNIFYLILCFTAASVFGLFEMCNHKVEMKAGEKLYINSPYYPSQYPIGSSCRYMIKAPQDYKLKFTCNIKLTTPPSNVRCHNEIFYFNREGSEILTDSEFFCGSGKLERKSFLNQAVLSYISKPLYKRIITNFVKESQKATTENEIKKILEQQQKMKTKTTTTTKTPIPPTTFKALKENQLTILMATKNKTTATTTTAPIAMNNNLSITVTQPFSSTTSSAISLALKEANKKPDKKVTNSFAYVLTLLSNKIDKEAFATATTSSSNKTATRPTSVLNFHEYLPANTWHNGSIATHKTSTKRGEPNDYTSSQLTTASNSTPTSSVAYNTRSSEAGGWFSCLAEVIEPQCECGWSSTVKIAGASGVAGINEFPSMAGIMTIKNHKIFCGATIIHHRYLLSAAHCYLTTETSTAEYLTAVVGELDVSSALDSLYTRQYDLVKIIPHEKFQAAALTVHHDIAVLKTRLSIEWSRSVGPACLPFYSLQHGRETIPYAGQRVETAGWGTTSFGGQQSSLLLKTTLDVISRSACQNLIGVLPFGEFCTYTPAQDTCQYDSGGALYVRGERLYAVGIVSYGYACATKKPSINTRISSYINWIRSHTPDAKYCFK